MNSEAIAAFFYPTLIAIVGFFLLQFYFLVKKMNDTMTEIKIKLATGEMEFKGINERIQWLEQELDKLKELVYKQKI